MGSDKITKFLAEIRQELIGNILDFWINYAVDNEFGGFKGRILQDNRIIPDAPKGSVLNARILWTFSAAAIELKDRKYFEIADFAYKYYINHFIDQEFGGVYWSVDFQGKPLETKKQIYSQAFAIYALSEYYKASQNIEALNYAIELFNLIEKYSFDKKKNGYFEAYSRSWELLKDLRLSFKDNNEAKTMNTHLHILEAYTSLFRIWPDDKLKIQLENLLMIHTDRLLNKETCHLNLFFDEDWNLKSDLISYGHDIEASWLMEEAAKALHNPDLIDETQINAINLADTTIDEGIMADGSLIYETHSPVKVDTDRHWWPQAEAMVGFVNAYQISKIDKYLNAAINNWEFIKKYLINPGGEWYWSVYDNYQPNLNEDKVGFWKCPYHNTRACLELLKRLY